MHGVIHVIHVVFLPRGCVCHALQRDGENTSHVRYYCVCLGVRWTSRGVLRLPDDLKLVGVVIAPTIREKPVTHDWYNVSMQVRRIHAVLL